MRSLAFWNAWVTSSSKPKDVFWVKGCIPADLVKRKSSQLRIGVLTLTGDEHAIPDDAGVLKPYSFLHLSPSPGREWSVKEAIFRGTEYS